jgi:hypothetical protein
MGYTRYWDLNKNEIENKDLKWKEYCAYGKVLALFLELSYGIKIKGWEGLGGPEFSDEVINFNGDAIGGLYHDSFLIPKEYSNDDVFNFCKTARKPYDVMVYMMLEKGKELGFLSRISDDGEVDDEFYNEVKENFKRAYKLMKINK